MGDFMSEIEVCQMSVERWSKAKPLHCILHQT